MHKTFYNIKLEYNEFVELQNKTCEKEERRIKANREERFEEVKRTSGTEDCSQTEA